MREQSIELFSEEEKRLKLREDLIFHPVFTQIKGLEELRLFMEAHVFAVWDFMSLVKRLQREICCVNVPWLPPKDNAAARLINEIVLGEETDQDHQGGFQSHFELYISAMHEVGASSMEMTKFVEKISKGIAWKEALYEADILPAVRDFTYTSLDIACYGSQEEVMGAFLYGREELIPNMFAELLRKWSIAEESVPRLTHYIKRHIELDRDEHGPAAEQLLARISDGHPKARERVLRGAIRSMDARKNLWDALNSLFKSHRLAS